MRLLAYLLMAMLLTGCADCRDTGVGLSFCDQHDDCADGERCDDGACVGEGTSWFGNPDEAARDRPADAGWLGDTDRSIDDDPGFGPSDRLPPSTQPIQPAPDREPECEPTQNHCADNTGFCVGAYCVPKCYEQIDCASGEVCRGDGDGGLECVEAIECGPGGSGGGALGTCHQEWLDCSGNTYQVVCKATEPPDGPGFLEHTPVLCTCYENQMPGKRFEWLGEPCVGIFDIEVFYNEKCDWALPLPGHG